MFQVFVKTTLHMRGHHQYDFASAEDRRQFLKDHASEIWWYFFPEEDEFFGASGGQPSWDNPRGGHAGWKKGGAWDAQQEAPGGGGEYAPEPSPPAVTDMNGDRW